MHDVHVQILPAPDVGIAYLLSLRDLAVARDQVVYVRQVCDLMDHEQSCKIVLIAAGLDVEIGTPGCREDMDVGGRVRITVFDVFQSDIVIGHQFIDQFA